MSALAEMYVQGVSTRKVKAITEELCGHTFSASTVSRINTGLDELLRRFAQRRLEEAYPYVILDARYEKVRLDGVIQSQAVFIALGINWEGRRQVLGVELSTRESQSSWTTFVNGLQARGLQGVAFVVSDDHAGIKRAVRELLPEAVWQRCYVHFLRNALDYLPRKADDDCRQELRWLYDRRNLKEAQEDLQAWLTRWESRYPKLTDWVEATIGETLNFYSLPRQHHKHLKSTNMLEDAPCGANAGRVSLYWRHTKAAPGAWTGGRVRPIVVTPVSTDGIPVSRAWRIAVTTRARRVASPRKAARVRCRRSWRRSAARGRVSRCPVRPAPKAVIRATARTFETPKSRSRSRRVRRSRSSASSWRMASGMASSQRGLAGTALPDEPSTPTAKAFHRTTSKPTSG